MEIKKLLKCWKKIVLAVVILVFLALLTGLIDLPLCSLGCHGVQCKPINLLNLSCDASLGDEDMCKYFVSCEYHFPKCVTVKKPGFEKCEECHEQCNRMFPNMFHERCIGECAGRGEMSYNQGEIDPSLCEATNQHNKLYCYSITAYYTKNEELCKKVGLSDDIWNKDMCYFRVAHRKQDAEICDNIVETALKEECKSFAA